MDTPINGFIGIDLGTSGCRGCVINQQGDILTEARTDLPTSISPYANHIEQAPQDWWLAALHVLDQLLSKRIFTPKAISIDGTSSTLLICDTQGKPLTPGLMYNDTRSTQSAKKLREIAPPENPVHSASSALAKLIHLQNQETFDRSARALHQADWIAGQLTGEYLYSDENNALKLGYDPVQRSWPNWLDQLPAITDMLPKVVPVGTSLSRLKPELMRRWQCSEPIQIIAGTTDSNAATIAAGIQQQGDAVTSLGSTLVIKVLSDKPIFCAKHGIYSHRLYDHWLIGGASNTGGQVLAHYFSKLEMEKLSQQINPENITGLDYYPLIKPGERFPINDDKLQPRLSPQPENPVLFFQGLLEGIAKIEQRGYQLLHELGAPYPARILSSGGGAKNRSWQEIRHRLLKTPVIQAKHTEAAYGSALIAAQKRITF